MKLLKVFLITMATMNNLQAQSTELKTLIDFSDPQKTPRFIVVNDGVMGGLSEGNFQIQEDVGIFEGNISLENNGGFSSVRFRCESSMKDAGFIRLKLKGDGKNYQFRIKARATDYYSYIYTFSTSGEWEEITIPISEMYASFRGRRLNLPQFSEKNIQELTLLIGNKKRESFRLELSSVELTR